VKQPVLCLALCGIALALAVLISSCNAVPSPMDVGILSAEAIATESPPVLSTATKQDSGYSSSGSASPSPTDVGVLSPEATSLLPVLSIGMEQNFGYHHAEQASDLRINYKPENDPQKEFAVTVRDLVEDKNQPVIAMVGATSNESSMRLASLANFFNTPVMIPSAVGDNILPSNNLWGFRLSASGASHAQYFFGSVLTRLMVSSFSVSDESALAATPAPFRVAIFYEQNTFGESAAVAAAKEAMKQGIEIGFYGSFDPSTPDSTRLKGQADEIGKQGIHLVYLISSQPKAAQIVIKAIRSEIPQDERPVLLGQSGAFSSLEFLGDPEAQGMFVLRQKIVRDQCPPEIKSLTEAQSYAAIVLLRSAMQQAKEQAGNTYAAQTLAQKREAMRDVLKATNNKDLDCLGQVSFDNTGQNKNLQFEILQITPDGPVVIDTKAFGEILKPIYDHSPFDSGQ